MKAEIVTNTTGARRLLLTPETFEERVFLNGEDDLTPLRIGRDADTEALLDIAYQRIAARSE